MSRTVGSNTFVYSYDLAHKHAVQSNSLNGNPYTYTYDLNGNMTGGPDFSNLGLITNRSISYNADNMPVQIVHSVNGTTTWFMTETENGRKKRLRASRPNISMTITKLRAVYRQSISLLVQCAWR